MPFTPFHFGPALLLKAATPKKFSFFIFCYSQVVIDLEVAYHIIFRQHPLHGFAHTYLGALAVALFCGLSGMPLHRLVIYFFRISPFGSLILNPLMLKVSLGSALIGTMSHVLLDSLMHGDIVPFAPFTNTNALLGGVDLQILHLFCVVTGILGLVWCAVLAKNRK